MNTTSVYVKTSHSTRWKFLVAVRLFVLMCFFFPSHQILEFQMQAILEERLRMKHKKKDLRTEKPSDVKFSCRGCSQYVCSGEDIQVIEDAHRVNVSPEFRLTFFFFFIIPNIVCIFSTTVCH